MGGEIPGRDWQERPIRGCATFEEEAELFERQAEQIQHLQDYFERHNGRLRRGLHAKTLLALTHAEVEIEDIAEDLQVVPFFKPGNRCKAVVRFSNASSEYRVSDSEPKDLRGAAVRMFTSVTKGSEAWTRWEEGGPEAVRRCIEQETAANRIQDFLMTNANPHHARDAREAVDAIMASRFESLFEQERNKAELVLQVGLREALRMGGTLDQQMSRPVQSLAMEEYWSRAPFAFSQGPEDRGVAVQYALFPVGAAVRDPGAGSPESDLRREMVRRLTREEVRFRFWVRRFEGEAITPIEDASVQWPRPDELFATLTIPRQSVDLADQEFVDALTFSPWNGDSDRIKPIGSMNRARRVVYPASAAHRKEAPAEERVDLPARTI